MKHITTLFISFLFTYSGLTLAENKQPLPNIVLFVVDDMGLMDTSVPFITDGHGHAKTQPLNKLYKTPNMELLADNGIRYSNFYAHSVCSPSRVSLLTGQNSTRHHTTQWIKHDENNAGQFGPEKWNWQGLNKSHQTLGKTLSPLGYETIFVGKAHFGPLNSVGEDPLNIGFSKNIGGGAWGSPGSYLGTKNFKRKKSNSPYQVPHLAEYHGKDIFLTEALTLEANKAVTQAVKSNTPFFLNMSHYAIHSPFTADKRFADDYANIKEMNTQTKQYATMAAGVDKSLGDIILHLNKLDIADNTLILFVGDNGSDAPIAGFHDIASSAPLRGKKGTHYEGGMRVPFIAAWVKSNKNNYWQKKMPITTGKIQEQMASILDIYPTITQLLDIKDNKSKIDGYPLQKTLQNKTDNNKPETFLMHFPHEHRSSYFTAYREKEWKLVYHYFPKHVPVGKKHTNYNTQHLTYELYNLVQDPSEQNNLYKKEPKQLKYMLEAMKSQLQSEDAQLPKGITYQDIH